MSRKAIFSVVIMLMTASWLPAQDFKLYFANNVTDVLDFNNIEATASGLEWREVKNKELAGNVVEVDAVKQMFASPDVKYRAQQRQFWRMRDHCLLCFRIDDDTNGANSYQVEVEDTIGRPKAITVSRFFFLNVMRQENPISVKVWNTEDPENAITFKYYVADWDDDNLYTFQLDSKRRLDNEVYSLEYRYSYADADGTYQVESRQLELRDSAFQSFYIADNQNLIDVFLMSNNHRLRLNKTRIHTGVTLDPDFERTVLSPRFTLDKHENRELVNFNWIGSGLYEQYDTLYLNVINETGGAITRTTMHVDPVDEYGVSTGVQDVKYLGYNKKKKAHLILTHGNPAYIEILATGYCPTFYRYPGAADKEGIVDLERCTDNVVMFENPADNETIAVSSQHLYSLNDTHTVEVRNGMDYSVCDLVDYDLSTVVQADTITFMEDAGNDWPKTLDGKVVQRLAQVELVYSSEGSQDFSSTRLIATNDENGEEYVSRWPDVTTVYARNHPGFTRDYFFSTFNLVGTIPLNSMCTIRLEANGKSFDRFPYLRNLSIDREALKKTSEEYTTNNVTNMGDDSPGGAYAEQGVSLNFPLDFKMNLGPLFKIRNTINYDMKKQTLTSTTKLTYKRQDGKDEDESIKEMRKEAKDFIDDSDASGHTWYDGAYGTKYSNVGDTRKFDDWFAQEMDDICSIDYNNIGTGFFGSGKLKFTIDINKLIHSSKYDFQDAFLLNELSGTIGYGICLASPSLLDKYWSSGPVSELLQKIPFFGIGGVFEASVQGDFGFKTFNPKYIWTMDNFGAFFTLSGKIRAGLWAELCAPSNPIFAANLGVRGGGKIGIMGGFATPFQANRFCLGLYLMAGIGIEAYANIRTFGFQWSGRAGVYLADHFYYPDNGRNPLHEDFPYWLTGKGAKTVGESYRRIPTLEADEFGETIVTDIASDANPHFIDDSHIVYNDLGSASDYNDDCVRLLDTNSNTTQKLSSDGFSAIHHMRSKRGGNEVVVYEQMGRQIDAAEMDAEQALAKSNELAACAKIMASVKLEGRGWQQFSISQDDGFVDTHPVVTMQDDGKAACIWQHGTIKTIDESLPSDSIYNNTLEGDLRLSIFDGQEWSQPITLHELNADLSASEYDLIMRNDTVLVGTNLESYPLDSARHTRRFIYSSVDLNTKSVFQKAETLKPSHFFMNRVGQYSVIAMLYQKTDSLRDIYVKTLSMNGYADGMMGSDIGANYSTPNRVKIITDRSAINCNDFAILWTEMSNNAHFEDGQEGFSETPRNMLNASRITLQPSPFITVPLTVGAERDGLSIMDFDGVLDDSRIKVVYSLADIETGGAVLMTNEKYFTNSFDYDIGYASLALLGSSTLPISVVISNTGTSSIRTVTATINGIEFPIENSYVAPMQKRTFVIQYPLTESFDGYISNSVTVEYNNTLKMQNHPRRRNVSMLRQTKSNSVAHHVDLENIELRLVRHDVVGETNNFVVELIDRSLYGLKSNNTIHVGLYPHPCLVVPLSDESETVVSAEDFEDYGGVRKAYATVSISGIKEQAHAYLTTHLYDLNNTDDLAASHVNNYSGSNNSHYVALLPHQTPNGIVQLRTDPERKFKVQLSKTEEGINVSGLKKGNHLRVFTSSGIVCYSKKSNGSQLFVPLKYHDTYLISTGKEVVKFSF